MKLSLIVAMTRDGLIGKGGGLPWGRIPADMRHFRALTMDKWMIVGRTTHDAICPLDHRVNYVYTRRGLRCPGGSACWDFMSAVELFDLLEYHGRTHDGIVIGGASVYNLFRDHVSEAHVTLVDGEFEGDVYFPFRLFGTPEWEPVADPVTLAPGAVYHKLGRVARP